MTVQIMSVSLTMILPHERKGLFCKDCGDRALLELNQRVTEMGLGSKEEASRCLELFSVSNLAS